ncbi:ABC transporter substrate-binding protein [Haloarchaeobius sp. FL176]|uniref:ABC transporter substrate-binding protein n=1 Tax=Haloarchaeobius sp. FL176 TaxID=2967129 RepID=UPI0021475844|nr:ABC transporter substrate-binding protein [Haloarchaeobius sp. FL176]
MSGNNTWDTVDRRTVLRAAGAAGIGGLAGCLGGGGDEGGANDLTVGVATSLSGPFSVFGQAALDGAMLAVEDLEEELGVSITVEDGDTQLDPQTGVSQLQRMVTEAEADFTMGAVSSSAAQAMASWANENEVIYMPTGAHGDGLTGAACGPYSFRPTASNSMLAASIGAEMAESADSWYLLYSDYAWGDTAQSAVSRILEEQGKEVVGRSATPFPADDYSPYLNEADNSDADGIGMLIAGLDLRKASNQLVSQGMQGDYTLAMHQLEDAVFWGLDRESAGILDSAGQVWGPAVDTDASVDFCERVAESSNTDPYVRHFLGYLSMDQAVRAAVRADSTNADDMRGALEGHEVSSMAADIKGGDSGMYWREGDHQLIQPTYTVEAMDVETMSEDPYKRWFQTVNTFDGDDVARPVSETGCSM